VGFYKLAYQEQDYKNAKIVFKIVSFLQ